MKRLLIALLAIVTIYSCQKKEQTPALHEQEVVFAIDEVDPSNNLKSAFDWECPTDNDGNLLEPYMAEIIIDGVSYFPEVYRLDGKLYTQAIKLEAPETGTTTYNVTRFVLMADDGQGTIIMATPEEGAEYAEYVNKPVDFDFEVSAFTKAEVGVEVLCFLPEEYAYFGFTWFNITEIVVREFCFFGDICLNGDPFTPADFEGSLYGNNLQVDIPAIMKIVVKDQNGDEVPNSPFNNEDVQAGAPLCAMYPDMLNVPETFTFEVWLWLPDETGFSYQLYATYSVNDDGDLDIDDGGDGVVDFVVGSCGYEGQADATFDFLYPPPAPDFVPFYIRNNDGSITPPWDADMSITENAAGDGFSAVTPRGGQKVGYGTNMFDNVQINKFETVNWNKISGATGIVSYLNFWVTDGTNWAIISSENDYRGDDFATRQEWKVFEYDAGVGLDWLFDSGTGGRDGAQYLTLDGARITLNQVSDNITLLDPGSHYPAYVGTGAPRGGYGFQLIFGDTQNNFIGSYELDNLTVTVDGVTYHASN